jgi:hypothetical protein
MVLQSFHNLGKSLIINNKANFRYQFEFEENYLRESDQLEIYQHLELEVISRNGLSKNEMT